MLNILKRIIDDIKQGENLDVYISVPLAIIIAVLGILNQVSFEIIGASILGTLALLSASLLSNRKASSEIKTTTEKFNTIVSGLEQSMQKNCTVTDVQGKDEEYRLTIVKSA